MQFRDCICILSGTAWIFVFVRSLACCLTSASLRSRRFWSYMAQLMVSKRLSLPPPHSRAHTTYILLGWGEMPTPLKYWAFIFRPARWPNLSIQGKCLYFLALRPVRNFLLILSGINYNQIMSDVLAIWTWFLMSSLKTVALKKWKI